jgi:hypothetical protein
MDAINAAVTLIEQDPWYRANEQKLTWNEEYLGLTLPPEGQSGPQV